MADGEGDIGGLGRPLPPKPKKESKKPKKQATDQAHVVVTTQGKGSLHSLPKGLGGAPPLEVGSRAQSSTDVDLLSAEQPRTNSTGNVLWLANELRNSLFGAVYQSAEVPAAVLGNLKLDPKYYYEQVAPSNWKPEDRDSYLSLYRRAYYGHCDVVFPVLFVGALAVLSYFAVLPLWALLLITPVLLLIGLQCLLLQVGGRPSALGSSRVMASFVGVLELLTPALFCLKVLSTIPEKFVENAVLLTASFFTVVLHYWCMASDPGYVQAPGPGDDKISSADHVTPEIQPLITNWCQSCNRRQPLRSKHCSVCNKCIDRFDHHCPAIHNCVGVNNQKLYSLYVFAMMLSQCLFVHLSGESLWREAESIWVHNSNELGVTWATKLGTLWTVCNTRMGVALLSIYMIPLAAGTCLLVLRGLLCSAGNITTNELHCRSKYSYLKDNEGRFLNRFDNGLFPNWLLFWSNSRADWEAELSTERLHAIRNHVPPTLSVTSLVRLWDSRQQTLMAARAQRQHQREQWLLQRYGGVPNSSPEEPTIKQCCSRPPHAHDEHDEEP